MQARTLLTGVIAMVLGVILGAALGRERPRETGIPLPVGAVIEVEEPTGEYVTAGRGVLPQPKMRTTRYRVVYRRGEAGEVPEGVVPTRIVVDGIIYVCVPTD